MTIHPLFTVHFMYYQTKWSDPYIKTFTTLSGVQSVLHFTAVRYPLHKCSETILCLKRQLTTQVSPISRTLGFTEARKTRHRVVGTSIWSIPYSGDLCNKNGIVRTSETLIVLSASCYTAGSDKSDAIVGVPDRLLK